MNRVLRVAILGGGIAGQVAATILKRMLGDKVHVVIHEARARPGGKVSADPVRKTNRGWGLIGGIHLELLNILEIWFGSKEVMNQYYFTFGADGEAARRYAGKDGGLLDTAAVVRGLKPLREHIKKLIERYGIATLEQTALTAEQQRLNELTVADLRNHTPLPGGVETLPEVSAAAWEIFFAIISNDNGFLLSEMNLLAFLRMFWAAGRDYVAGSEGGLIEGGASVAVDFARAHLEAQGVEFHLQSLARLPNEDEPIIEFPDGRRETYDFVVLAVSPFRSDVCKPSPDFQPGRACFWYFEVDDAYLKQIENWDLMAPWGQVWKTSTADGKPVIAVYVGGPAYDSARTAPPFALLDKVFTDLSAHVVGEPWTHHWLDDPNELGAFCFPMKAKIDAGTKVLARQKNRRVKRAGEHLGPSWFWFGYWNADVESGEFVANEIVEEAAAIA